MKVKGDLIELADTGRFNLIIHGTNCFNIMGAGIAKKIAKKWPKAAEVDSQTDKGDIHKLGGVSIAFVEGQNGRSLTVVNAYTQYRYGRTRRHVDYDSVRACFSLIAEWFGHRKDELRIGYPKIGAGLAGGDWDTIQRIIDEELEGYNHTLVEYSK